MPRINLLPDELYEADRPGEPMHAAPAPTTPNDCPGCLGKGRYVGLILVEDPCRFCNGSGIERASGAPGSFEGPPQHETEDLPF